MCGFLTFLRPYWERVKYNCKMNCKTEFCIIDVRIQKDVSVALFTEAISVCVSDIFLCLLLNEVGKDQSTLEKNNIL